ncbi:MAG: acyltransferase [Paludibacteraceae bacterium]|nr:acyltransferase [Paludibacteraceae bacterium]
MRQSNIELLRIVSMFFIVLEHVLIMGTEFFSAPMGNQLYVANTIIGFTYIGVNCFILITGYFGADFSWKRLINLYLVCCFYELVGFVVAYYHGDVECTTTAIGYIIFPLSRSNTWFIRCYVILLFLLPIINLGLEQLNKRNFLYVLLLLTLLNLYFGWFQKQENYNAIGYNPSQMIYLYVIGQYLNRFVDWQSIKKRKFHLIISWILLSLLWGIIQNLSTNYHIPHWNGWAYNNPIVLSASIIFFAYFLCLDIPYSKIINSLGVAMLGVFLIHMNRYLGNYIYGFVNSIVYYPTIAQSIIYQICILIGVSVGVYFMSYIIEIPRWIINDRDCQRRQRPSRWFPFFCGTDGKRFLQPHAYRPRRPQGARP